MVVSAIIIVISLVVFGSANGQTWQLCKSEKVQFLRELSMRELPFKGCAHCWLANLNSRLALIGILLVNKQQLEWLFHFVQLRRVLVAPLNRIVGTCKSTKKNTHTHTLIVHTPQAPSKSIKRYDDLTNQLVSNHNNDNDHNNNNYHYYYNNNISRQSKKPTLNQNGRFEWD